MNGYVKHPLCFKHDYMEDGVGEGKHLLKTFVPEYNSNSNTLEKVLTFKYKVSIQSIKLLSKYTRVPLKMSYHTH